MTPDAPQPQPAITGHFDRITADGFLVDVKTSGGPDRKALA